MEPQNNDKQQAISRLIEDVRTARAAGKVVDDAVTIGAHAELMPELGEALVRLRRIEAAARLADQTVMAGSATGSDTDQTMTAAVSVAVPEALLAELQRPTMQIPGYTLLKELSRGGQGVVYLAVQLSTGRKIAIKVMREGPLADERSMARFQREVQVLAALNHPNIVNIIDTGMTPDGSRYLVMNYIAGSSLNDYMKRRHRKDAADPSKLLRTFLKICDAVNAAHLRGIVHRDLKPSNIRVDERGEPHVLDFGLARAGVEQLSGTSEPLSITGEFLGSLPWSSPEQAEGDPAKIDTRTDVYSLGVILYQMLTGGRFPYEVVGNIRDVLNNILTVTPMPPSKVIADLAAAKAAQDKDWAERHRPPVVNEGIERVVLKALAKERDRRYQTAGEMGKDVANYLRGLPTGQGAASAAGVKERAPKVSTTQPSPLARWKMPAAAVAALLVLLTSLMGGWLFFRHNRNEPGNFPSTPIATTGWQSLFNGKDLTGWHKGQGNFSLADWSTRDGVLQGIGNSGIGALQTDRTDYGDFHLRVVTRLCTPQSAMRAGIGLRSHVEEGFQVVIGNKVQGASGGSGAVRTLAKAKGEVHQVDFSPDEWFTLDIVHMGAQVTVDLNGQRACECNDPSYDGLKGPIEILLGGGGTVCAIKSIDVMELSAPPLAIADATGASKTPAPLPEQPSKMPPPSANASPPAGEWKNLFQDNALTGWHLSADNDRVKWSMKDGVLTATGQRGFLVTDRNDFDNFDLRLNVLMSAGGNSGIFFRTGDLPLEHGYQVQISDDADSDPNKTGSVDYHEDSSRKFLRRIAASPVSPGVWTAMEIIVDGPQTKVLINGVLVNDATYAGPAARRGAIALEFYNPGMTLQFRDVRLWEYPSRDRPPIAAVSDAGPAHDLLKGLDVRAATVSGDWRMNQGELIGSGQAARVDFAAVPPAEYDYRVVFTRIQGTGEIGLICARGDTQVEFGLSGGTNGNLSRMSGLARVDNLPYFGRGRGLNPTMNIADKALTNNAEHTVIVRVRNDNMEATLDGAQLMNFKTDYKNLSLAPELGLPHRNTVGLWINDNVIRVRVAELTNATAVKTPAAAKSDPRQIDLLKLVDVQKDQVSATWTMANGELRSGRQDSARIQFPCVPPAEYDFRLVFTRNAGNADLSVLLAENGQPFEFMLGGWLNTIAGFANLNNRGADNNRTTQKSDSWLTNGQRYTLVVKVRKDSATAFLDGKQICTLQTDYHEVTLRSGIALPRKGALGLNTWQSSFTIHEAEVQEITGHGQLLRELPAGPPSTASAPRRTDTSTAPAPVKPDPFQAGSAWIGTRHYRQGAFAGGSVSYELYVDTRDGDKFTGHKFDNGHNRNRAPLEGEIHGDAITWTENAGVSTVTSHATLKGGHIHFTFDGAYTNGTKLQGDGDADISSP